MNTKEKFYRCACGSEVLCVTSYDDNDVEVCIYHYNYKQSLCNRIRNAYRMLKGKPYGDQVILQPQDVRDLVDQLVEIQNEQTRDICINKTRSKKKKHIPTQR